MSAARSNSEHLVPSAGGESERAAATADSAKHVAAPVSDAAAFLADGAANRCGVLAERYLGRLRTERGAQARTLAAYRIDLRELWQSMGGKTGRGENPSRDRSAAGRVYEGSAIGSSAFLPDGQDESAMYAALDEAAVRAWIARRHREGLSPRSIARKLSAWRGFFDWLIEQGLLKANPARGVRAPRGARRLPKALAPDAAVSLVASDTGDDFESLRDRAMFELLYSSGLRLSELTGLDACYMTRDGVSSSSWLSLDEAQVTVTGKGARRRTVPVGRHALTALRRWLDVRETFLAGAPAQADRHALFLNRRGRRIDNRTVQRRLHALALALGIPARVHPHVLRHSFASHLLQSSGDLRAVQELLGHASVASTQVYTALDFQRLAAVYDAAHPRARRQNVSARSQEAQEVTTPSSSSAGGSRT